MLPLLLMVALVAPVASARGVNVPAPEDWVASRDGETFVFSSPSKDASLRVDLFVKDSATDPQDCVDQLVDRLSRAEKASKESYTPGAIDGQPSATQVTVAVDRKHRQKRLVGCNGKSYFLIDWIELTHAGPKYEKAFTKLLTSIRYAAPKAP